MGNGGKAAANEVNTSRIQHVLLTTVKTTEKGLSSLDIQHEAQLVEGRDLHKTIGSNLGQRQTYTKVG